MSLRSEPTAREKEGGKGIGPGQEGGGGKPDKMKEPKTKNVEKKKGDVERERTKGREDQCKTNVVHYRVKTNTQCNGQLWRKAVFTPVSCVHQAISSQGG